MSSDSRTTPTSRTVPTSMSGFAVDVIRGREPRAEYIDLGFLQGTVGGQNYDLPDEFDPDVHRTVLIWCLRFAVPFATAPLS